MSYRMLALVPVLAATFLVGRATAPCITEAERSFAVALPIVTNRCIQPYPPSTIAVYETANRKIVVVSRSRPWSDPTGFSEPKAGMEFLLLAIRWDNLGAASQSYNALAFEVQEMSGVRRQCGLHSPPDRLGSGDIPPGGFVVGNVVCEVASSAGVMNWIVDWVYSGTGRDAVVGVNW